MKPFVHVILMKCPSAREVMWTLRSIFMFIPNLFHNLFHAPEDDDDQHTMVWEFGQALRHIPQLFRTLAFKTRTLEEQLHQVCDGRL